MATSLPQISSMVWIHYCLHDVKHQKTQCHIISSIELTARVGAFEGRAPGGTAVTDKEGAPDEGVG